MQPIPCGRNKFNLIQFQGFCSVCPDQGRAFHHASKHPSSNHWIQSGAFTYFAEYRFAMKGRLNLLPTESVARRVGKPYLDTTCPKCWYEPETLGQVLNACTPSMGLVRERHNLVLQRLVRAVPDLWETCLLNRRLRILLVVENQIWWFSTGVRRVPLCHYAFRGRGEAFSKARGSQIYSWKTGLPPRCDRWVSSY